MALGTDAFGTCRKLLLGIFDFDLRTLGVFVSCRLRLTLNLGADGCLSRLGIDMPTTLFFVFLLLIGPRRIISGKPWLTVDFFLLLNWRTLWFSVGAQLLGEVRASL